MRNLDFDRAQPVSVPGGSAIPIAALHGSAASARQWSKLAAHLADDFRFLAPDMYAGAGAAASPLGGSASLQARADGIAATLEACGRPVHLIGHSAGGVVAAKIALCRPDLVASLTLIEPVLFHLLGAAGVEEKKLLQEIEALAGTVAKAEAEGNPALGMAQFVNFWNGARYWTTLPADRRIRLAAQCGQVADDFAATIGETWPLADARKLAMPVLLMMGLQSQPVALRITEMLAETISGARLIVVPYGGHMAPVTHAAIVNSAIARHVRMAEAGFARPAFDPQGEVGQRAA